MSKGNLGLFVVLLLKVVNMMGRSTIDHAVLMFAFSHLDTKLFLPVSIFWLDL